MTEPKKTTRRRTRARTAGAASIELKTPNGDGEIKVGRPGAIERSALFLAGSGWQKAAPEPNGPGAAAEPEQKHSELSSSCCKAE
jgi:hypothetical protein